MPSRPTNSLDRSDAPTVAAAVLDGDRLADDQDGSSTTSNVSQEQQSRILPPFFADSKPSEDVLFHAVTISDVGASQLNFAYGSVCQQSHHRKGANDLKLGTRRAERRYIQPYRVKTNLPYLISFA